MPAVFRCDAVTQAFNQLARSVPESRQLFAKEHLLDSVSIAVLECTLIVKLNK